MNFHHSILSRWYNNHEFSFSKRQLSLNIQTALSGLWYNGVGAEVIQNTYFAHTLNPFAACAVCRALARSCILNLLFNYRTMFRGASPNSRGERRRGRMKMGLGNLKRIPHSQWRFYVVFGKRCFRRISNAPLMQAAWHSKMKLIVFTEMIQKCVWVFTIRRARYRAENENVGVQGPIHPF